MEWIMRSGGEGSQISTHLHLACLDDLKGVVGEMERGEIPVGIGAASTMQPPTVFSSLRRLTIVSCNKMRKLGLQVSTVPNLEEIFFASCGGIQEVFEEDDEEEEGREFAITLPRLTKLYLNCLSRLRKVGLSASQVPNLESIIIRSCGEIQEIFKEDGRRDSATTLPKLTNSELVHLARLRKVGLPAASGVPNLEVILIESCGEIQEIFEDGDEDADEDEGRDALNLPKLEKLWFSSLPRLERVSKATLISNSIHIITIWKCPRLMNKLPLHVDVPPVSELTIEKIRVEREWWESLEWDDPNLPQLLQPFLDFEDEEELNEQEEDEDEDGDGDE